MVFVQRTVSWQKNVGPVPIATRGQLKKSLVLVAAVGGQLLLDLPQLGDKRFFKGLKRKTSQINQMRIAIAMYNVQDIK